MQHKLTVAIGANIGDRCVNIDRALREMERHHEVVTITGTSYLYESPPMYVTEQPAFLNCAITAETTLEPVELLSLLKHVETLVGRVAGIRNGPRAVDLDIVFYDALVLDTRTDGGDGSKPGELVIPHPRLAEREFVLRPLSDLIPEYIHPILKKSVRSLLAAHPGPSKLRKIFHFPAPRDYPLIAPVLWQVTPSRRTYMMAVLNATPDSFSSTPADTDAAVAAGLAAVTAGADILDVGGYSTRPGAAHVSLAEEMERVVPVIKALRAGGVMLPISVDTFRPAVLQAAVAAGANCLNDVTALAGGVDDEENRDMVAAVRELRIPVIMMHSRGAHRAGEDKDYGVLGALAGVRFELGESVTRALRAGVRRWNVMIDPGYGFSKTTEGNVALLRGLRALTAEGDANPLEGFPVLAGLSRKSFLGAALGRETAPTEREWATAAAVAAAVQQGVDVVRVHDVGAMRDVVKISDTVWRGEVERGVKNKLQNSNC